MLTFLARITGVSPIVIEAIVFGALLLAFAGVGLHVYDKGYASAENKCQADALQAELEAVQKDLDNARAAAADASLKLAALQASADAEKEQTDAYVADLAKRPAPSCALTCDDLRGLRINSKACPASAVPRPAARSFFHGPGNRPGAKSP
jgi:hypothetical protein